MATMTTRGGVKQLLETKKEKVLSIYAHPDALDEKYYLAKGCKPRSVGIPWKQSELECLGAQFCLEKGPLDLGEGITLTGEIPRTISFEKTDSNQTIRMTRTDKGLIPDLLYDDQALAVETKKGVVAILGCAHSGLINTLQHIKKLAGGNGIYAFLGGTHLIGASDERMELTIEALNDFGLRLISPCHCTGPRATAILYSAFPNIFQFHHVGKRIEFE